MAPSQPTTFLSLPRELRQKILHDSFNTAYSIPAPLLLPALRYSEFGKRIQVCDIHIDWQKELKHVRAWVKTLIKVDENINEDVKYVAHKRIEFLQGMLKDVLKEYGLDGTEWESANDNYRNQGMRVLGLIFDIIDGRVVVAE
jgi:hypothetical protein